MDQRASLPQYEDKQFISQFRRRPILCYFILAYVLSWLIWLPYLLSTGGGLGVLPISTKPISSANQGLLGTVLIIVGSLGPAIAALIMSGIIGGSGEVKRLLRRMIQIRAGLQWYITVLMLPLLLSLPGLFLAEPAQAFSSLTSMRGLDALLVYMGGSVIDMVVGSPIGEEPGWRGFALPRLQRAYGPLLGSVLLGCGWALWHLPLFFTSWAAGYAPLGIPLGLLMFGLFVLGFTVVMTWVYNNTRGSIFLQILFHSAIDTRAVFLLLLFPQAVNKAPRQQSLTTTFFSLLVLAIGWLLTAGLVLLFTRGKLSYKEPEGPALVGAMPPLADGKDTENTTPQTEVENGDN